MKYIFDFDDVLFDNTVQFKRCIFERLGKKAGVSPEVVAEYYRQVRGDLFSLRDFITDFLKLRRKDGVAESKLYLEIMHECPKFVNKKLFQAIRDHLDRDSCYIVSYGNKEFNMDKIRYSGFINLFEEKNIHITSGEKHGAIAEICDSDQTSEFVFIDDKKQHTDEPELKGISNLTTIHYKQEGLDELMRKANDDSLVSELKRRR